MSSQQVLRIRPTKIELIKLKRRLALAKRIHRILRERLTILVAEFLSTVRNLVEERKELIKILQQGYENITLTLLEHSTSEIKVYGESLPQILELYSATKNIMGVKAPFLEVRFREEYKELEKPTSPVMSSALEKTRKTYLEIFERIASIAENEKTLELLGREIARTRRRVNILEHIIMPKLEATIKYLQMMFDEREREEKTRLKRVKAILSRRRGGER